MDAHGLDGLLLTTPPNVRYFSGFDTQFWESPTRPWFLVVPREGAPIAVIPEIGEAGMAVTWVDDIRTWPSPAPEDDGVTLLASALGGLPRRHGRIGAELGRESVVRMPVLDLDRLRDSLSQTPIADGTPVIRALRQVKSEAEVERIRHACRIVSDGFEALPAQLALGDSERDACRKLRIELLRRGADGSPYLMGVSGPGGYDNIIMGPTDRVMDAGDLLIIDTGTTYDGYFCDFDRNFAFGHAPDEARRAHEAVWRATQAGIESARPGATTSDVWRAQMQVLEAAGSRGNNVGRLGHGLGLQLTEPPSNTPDDDTVLVPGMVLTIEPGMAYAPGRMIVCEENLVVRQDGAELLSRRAEPELPVVLA
jgi:Xaa-Pro aminopeptidase